LYWFRFRSITEDVIDLLTPPCITPTTENLIDFDCYVVHVGPSESSPEVQWDHSDYNDRPKELDLVKYLKLLELTWVVEYLAGNG